MKNQVICKLKIHVRTPNETLVKIGNRGVAYQSDELFSHAPNIKLTFKQPYAKKLSGKEKRKASHFIVDILGSTDPTRAPEINAFKRQFGDDIIDDYNDDDNKYKLQYVIQNFLKTMEEEDNLVDFKPSNLPEPSPEKTEDHEIENDSQLNNDAVTQQYYNQYLPYYTKAADSQEIRGQRDHLIEKLNYMIHLLEEQQEEKTANITEELILYMFLGVFVIFVVDSFARAGKYTR